MPYLVKKVEGKIVDAITTQINAYSSVSFEIGFEDYFKIGKFEGFTQNFSQVTEVERFPNLRNYGLKNNGQFIELEISY